MKQLIKKCSIAAIVARAARSTFPSANRAGNAQNGRKAGAKTPPCHTNVKRHREPSMPLLYLAISLMLAALLWLNQDLFLDLLLSYPLFK